MPDQLDNQPTVDSKVAKIGHDLANYLKNIEKPEDRQLVAAQLATITLRALRPSFTGNSINPAGEAGMQAGQELAEALGKKYREGGDTPIYMFARGSDSASVVLTAQKEGEIYVIFERVKEREDLTKLEIPAGYRNEVSEDYLVPEQEALSNMKPPSQINLQAMYLNELTAMQHSGMNAEQIADRFDNPDEIKQMLKKSDINWDHEHHDATIIDNAVREVREEIGFDPDPKNMVPVRNFATVSVGSGGNRNNHEDHLFLYNMGPVDELPKPKLVDGEVAEALWVNLKDIQRNPESGEYTVDGLEAGHNQLAPTQTTHLELGLEAYVSGEIAKASHLEGRQKPLFDSVRDIESVLDKDTGDTFVGREGIDRIKTLTEQAKLMAEKIAAVLAPPTVGNNASTTPSNNPVLPMSIPLQGNTLRTPGAR